MTEIPYGEASQSPNIDPLCVRDKVIESIFVYKYTLSEELGLKIDRYNSSYPYELKEIEGYSEAGTFSSPPEFEAVLDKLGKEEYNAMMEEQKVEAALINSKARAIQQVYECLRFFWEEDGIFDLTSLWQVQRIANYPLWKSSWKFMEQMKPPYHFPESYKGMDDFYQKLDVGSNVRVKRKENPNEKVETEVESGEILGFTIGFQAQFHMEHLFVHFKDEQNWIHTRRLYELELDNGEFTNHPASNTSIL